MNALFDLSKNQMQRDFVLCPDEKAGYYGGVANGKTLAGCLRGILLSILIPGNRGLVGRLTYPELRDSTWKEFKRIVRDMNGGTLEPGPVIKRYHQQSETLEFTNGSEVIARYLEKPETILSMNLGWVYIDQAEEIPEETYLNLESRLRYWTPSRVEDWQKKTGFIFTPKHYLFITGNPAPGWVLKRYKENPTGMYKLFEAPSESNEANLAPGFLAGLRATYPAEWVRRFLDGQWDIKAGQIYKGFSEAVNVVEPFTVPDCWEPYIALDHGYRNPTAVLWAYVDEFGSVFITREHYQSEWIVSQHAEEIKKHTPRKESDGSILIWADPSTQGTSGIDGKSVQQVYGEFGIYLRPANNSVGAGILKVQEHFNATPGRKNPVTGISPAPALYIFNTCENLIRELKEYEWEKLRPGQEGNDPERPKKVNDHAVDALRYLIMAITEHGVKPKPKDNADPYDRYMMNVMDGLSNEPMFVDDGMKD